MRAEYIRQVALLVEAIPFIEKEQCFALKGGTAINLFHRDMPRLSVDIDLTYLPFDDRATAYTNINAALTRIEKALASAGYRAVIQGTGDEKKLIVSSASASIKVEPNYTLRGRVYEPALLGICERAEKEFGYAEMRVISPPELFGGKMCAALDRQHPRDLFDIALLLDDGDTDVDLMVGFIAMLLAHNRPVHELLDPVLKDQSEVFGKEFSGMTDRPFTYADHVAALERLVLFIRSGLAPYRDFLLDFVSLHADLSTAPIPNLDKLPAVLWKRQNLARLRNVDPAKFTDQYDRLRRILASREHR
ncbi:MAG TPA: nucleotidyl transferase AbiEii/AbiGii toxin family protein [Spirochaetia bacterium]|nr:nucleotidyl transferase AbiEii/AbiGii toxin family protein [Spirochaetia bacterium]